MDKDRVDPRERLVVNLRFLMEAQGLTSPQVAEAARIGRKTMNDVLKNRHNPRIGNVEKVANVFGLTTWQLLAFDMASQPVDSRQVLSILELYFDAPEEGRKAIMQVAELAGRKAAQ